MEHTNTQMFQTNLKKQLSLSLSLYSSNSNRTATDMACNSCRRRRKEYGVCICVTRPFSAQF